MTRPLVLVDLDDTLIDTSPVYENAIASLVDFLVGVLPGPPDPGIIRETQERIDAAWSHGDFDRTRFPRSFAETCRVLRREAGLEPDETQAAHCAALGEVVLTARPALLPHARELLEALRVRADVELYTLGVPEVQVPKIEEHGLQELLDRIHVVPRKDAPTLARLVDGRRPRAAILGDSLRFEINPALELSIFAVHVRRPHLWKFAQVPAHSPHYHEVRDLAEARHVLETRFLAPLSS